MIEMAEFALEKLREPRAPGDPALAGSGAEAAGSEVIEASSEALQVAADSLVVGGDVSSGAVRAIAQGANAAADSAVGVGGMALKGLRLFGNAALLLSFLAAIGTIIADGIEGAKQRDELIAYVPILPKLFLSRFKLTLLRLAASMNCAPNDSSQRSYICRQRRFEIWNLEQLPSSSRSIHSRN
jgi:hypothetical protein